MICVLCSVYVRRDSVRAILKNAADPRRLVETQSKSYFTVQFMKKNLPPGSLVLAQNPDLPLFADCIPAMSDTFSLTLKVKIGSWNPAPVVEALNKRRIPLVVTSENINSAELNRFFPEEVEKAIKNNYRLSLDYFGIYFYQPAQ